MDKKINTIRTRPRFKLETDLSKEDFELNLKTELQKNTEIQGNINKEVASIWVKTAHNEFWKPYLSLRVENEDEKTIIRGTFGPSAAVWTFFMFLYFIFSIIFMVFITIWFVTKQINSQDFPWAIYLAIFALVLLLLTFLATKIGQKKAKTEMEKLKNFAENSILK